MAAVAVFDVPAVPVTLYLRDDFSGQRIHHRDTHAVQTAGNRIGAAAELSPRMQDRHHDFDGGFVFRGVFRHRDAAPVVAHPQAAVGLNRHFDVVAIPGQGFVHRVIHDFVHQVV